MMDIARTLKPDVEMIVRVHNDDEAALLRNEGATRVFVGEHELASAMTSHIVERLADGIGRGAAIGDRAV
jgi:CPA2 family monovalent cation:H+ antiporter-2